VNLLVKISTAVSQPGFTLGWRQQSSDPSNGLRNGHRSADRNNMGNLRAVPQHADRLSQKNPLQYRARVARQMMKR
jgi:hypothetical protein